MSERAQIDTLGRLIAESGIEHFRARELGRLNPNAWEGDSFELPDCGLDRIIPTLRLADKIRQQWGGPVKVVSGYRPPAYNDAIGGADQSQHIEFRALDLRPDAEPFDLARYFTVVREVVDEARKGGQNVGLGLYYAGRGRFAHIDTNADKARNREWIRQ
jgi:uncharacterized protein YcbK (DUF882 family)